MVNVVVPKVGASPFWVQRLQIKFILFLIFQMLFSEFILTLTPSLSVTALFPPPIPPPHCVKLKRLGGRGSVALTLGEARRVVVNVCDHDGHRGGARETAHLSCHVCCLDDQLVTILRLTVQICHRRPDDAW